ncbi:redox-regulated ATPase YchF [Candidatus Dojkabacteria bacterium]|uniref:Ribosome-binding ATPase YchF n=1 Tax=Candidatus Dojkabacteria bacterium TaxID=2099670 RepID=A0A3M0Z2H7_9BACT|nr:MAG: redox-regulated ATPase YchF [Candidatus Dojkabacteria bacterium]
MGLSVGIVGLPNVGKSTLFNALTKQKVLAANYPFATIDPNVGVVPVADKRLKKISEIVKPERTVPATVEFIDIAGLVRGASEGMGLGNKFLSHIRQVDAILHLVRVFEDENVVHVEKSVNPIRDVELINTELLLKDIETVVNRIENIKTRARLDKVFNQELDHLIQIKAKLNDGCAAREVPPTGNYEIDQRRKSLCLLTDKPVIYVFNSSNIQYRPPDEFKHLYLVLDVKTEMELSEMNELEKAEFMKEFQINESGLDKLTKVAYQVLGLISFFTEGPKEVRAWTIRDGSRAIEAGSAIHTDFTKNFIACDVCSYEDFLEAGNWVKAKEIGKVRLEGRDYIVKDGDILVFRHG